MFNLAIVGTGGMAGWHAEQIKKIPELNVVALCDIVPEHWQTYREKHFPKAVGYDDFEALLADYKARKLKLDFVLLVTPHTVHYPHAKAALEAGLHVMVEKPMVTSSEHAYDLWRTVKKNGKLLAITFQAPYTPEYQCIAKLRDSGQLGKPQLIQGWLAQEWLKSQAGKWRQVPELSGGGQMYDSGAHILNGMMWIMNEPVVEVACFYDTCGSPVDINGVAIMKFQSGAMGSVAIGGACPGWNVAIQLQTDKMTVKTGPHGGFLETSRNGRHWYPPVEIEDHPAAGVAHLNFVRALQGKEQLKAPVRYGVLLSALMDAMYQSAKEQKPVKVKPVPADIEALATPRLRRRLRTHDQPAGEPT
jgi:predicted dehydrogenase